jgi:hypothetical protein
MYFSVVISWMSATCGVYEGNQRNPPKLIAWNSAKGAPAHYQTVQPLCNYYARDAQKTATCRNFEKRAVRLEACKACDHRMVTSFPLSSPLMITTLYIWVTHRCILVVAALVLLISGTRLDIYELRTLWLDWALLQVQCYGTPPSLHKSI